MFKINLRSSLRKVKNIFKHRCFKPNFNLILPNQLNNKQNLTQQEVIDNLKKHGLTLGDKLITNNMRATIVSFKDEKVVIQNAKGQEYLCAPETVRNSIY